MAALTSIEQRLRRARAGEAARESDVGLQRFIDRARAREVRAARSAEEVLGQDDHRLDLGDCFACPLPRSRAGR